MPLSLDDVLTIAPDVMFRHLNDEAVLLDLKSGTYFGLNDVGARTWQLILEHGRLSRVLEALLEEYAVERDAGERDLMALAPTCRATPAAPKSIWMTPPPSCRRTRARSSVSACSRRRTVSTERHAALLAAAAALMICARASIIPEVHVSAVDVDAGRVRRKHFYGSSFVIRSRAPRSCGTDGFAARQVRGYASGLGQSPTFGLAKHILRGAVLRHRRAGAHPDANCASVDAVICRTDARVVADSSCAHRGRVARPSSRPRRPHIVAITRRAPVRVGRWLLRSAVRVSVADWS